MNFVEKKVRKWLLSFLFTDGFKVGTHSVLIYDSYIDMGSGKIRNIGSVSGSVSPDVTSVYDLGTSGTRWKNVYTGTVSGSGNIVLSGTGTVTTPNLVVSSLATIGTIGNLTPVGDYAYGLGSATARFIIYLPTASSKPSPTVSTLGRILIQTGSGTASTIYICARNSANAYEWVQVGIST